MKKGTRFMHLAKVEKETRGALKDQKNIRIELAMMSCLPKETSQELRRVLPELLWISRAWHARFLVKGCLACHRKKVSYGSGGMCASCVGANREWIRKYVKQATADRNTAEETIALTLREDSAALLLSCNEAQHQKIRGVALQRYTELRKEKPTITN